jgi:2,4-dienoyl-CoA reductase-like NADH-dependent reductase (Old Yellow Enzyme family)
MVRLLQLYPWAGFDVAVRTYLRCLEQLLRQTRCFVMSMGRNVIADPDFAPRLLGEMMNS